MESIKRLLLLGRILHFSSKPSASKIGSKAASLFAFRCFDRLVILGEGNGRLCASTHPHMAVSSSFGLLRPRLWPTTETTAINSWLEESSGWARAGESTRVSVSSVSPNQEGRGDAVLAAPASGLGPNTTDSLTSCVSSASPWSQQPPDLHDRSVASSFSSISTLMTSFCPMHTGTCWVPESC